MSKGIGSVYKTSVNDGTNSIFTQGFIGAASVINEWLSPMDLGQSGDESPYVLPFDCELVAVSFSNQNTGSDQEVEIHSAPLGTNTTTRHLVIDCTNARYFRVSDFTPIQFSAGDKLGVFVADDGGNASDITCVLFFRITSLTNANVKNNTSGDLNRTASGGVTITL